MFRSSAQLLTLTQSTISAEVAWVLAAESRFQPIRKAGAMHRQVSEGAASVKPEEEQSLPEVQQGQ
jgi:hypothetical protein